MLFLIAAAAGVARWLAHPPIRPSTGFDNSDTYRPFVPQRPPDPRAYQILFSVFSFVFVTLFLPFACCGVLKNKLGPAPSSSM